jgi:hypothetical protein
LFVSVFVILVVSEFELRALTLEPCPSPLFCFGFETDSCSAAEANLDLTSWLRLAWNLR